MFNRKDQFFFVSLLSVELILLSKLELFIKLKKANTKKCKYIHGLS